MVYGQSHFDTSCGTRQVTNGKSCNKSPEQFFTALNSVIRKRYTITLVVYIWLRLRNVNSSKILSRTKILVARSKRQKTDDSKEIPVFKIFGGVSDRLVQVWFELLPKSNRSYSPAPVY